jgi:hypothetical protein
VCGTHNCWVQYNNGTQTFIEYEFTGTTETSFGCTLAGIEVAYAPFAITRTRYAWTSVRLATEIIMFDSTSHVFRSYDATTCAAPTSCSGNTVWKTVSEWYLSDNYYSNDAYFPDALLGGTEDGLFWVYDNRNKLYKGYDLGT